MINIPNVGLKSKLEAKSGVDRVSSIAKNIEAFKQNPIFGFGYYNGFNSEKLKFTGLPGVLAQIGLFGVFLYLLCWIYGLNNVVGIGHSYYLVPIFITMLISQPIYNQPFIILFCLISQKSDKARIPNP